MKRFVFFLLLVFGLGGCADDEEPLPRTFELLILNKSSTTYLIWQTNTIQFSRLALFDRVFAGKAREISLDVDVPYTFRLIEEGKSFEEYSHELEFLSKGENVRWEIED